MDSQKTLLVILGPTGVGKTELSLSVAEHYSSPIINADSRQIFKGIEIGTAAPVAEQLARVKHYFVHTLPLDGYYSAAEYENDVMDLLNTLFLTHDVVVLSGGSMMYIDAVTKGIDEIPTITEETRSYMKQRLEKEGLEALVCELERLDPEYAAVVDRHNTQRVVHALEICHQTRGTYTSLRTHKVKERPFRIVKIGLMREREELFDRINRRVDQMMTDGLLDEARSVYHLRNLNALNTVGYKEMFNVLDGEWELTMATERMKKNTRVYAKKQLTWYKHDSDITWINLSTTDEAHALDLIVNTVSNKEE